MYDKKTRKLVHGRLMTRVLHLNCALSEMTEELEQLNLVAKEFNDDQLIFDTESYIQALKQARLNNLHLEGMLSLIQENIINRDVDDFS